MFKDKKKEAPAFTAAGLPIDRSLKVEKTKAAKRAESAANKNHVRLPFSPPRPMSVIR